MKITRSVILDLLPLYDAGEACEDTKVLVEEYLRSDPEFAAQVAGQSAARLPLAVAAPSQDLEVKTMQRTKRMIRMRSWVMGLAIMFTALPFSVVWTDQVKWLMLRDAPEFSVASGTVGLILWAWYYVIGRQLRV